jgi:hypothetical protein
LRLIDSAFCRVRHAFGFHVRQAKFPQPCLHKLAGVSERPREFVVSVAEVGQDAVTGVEQTAEAVRFVFLVRLANRHQSDLPPSSSQQTAVIS